MRILMVNKFLERRGGVETYVIELGRLLSEAGHDVQYFGMDTPGRILSNDWSIYAPTIELSGGQGLSRVGDVSRTIESRLNGELISSLLRSFEPDVVHFNNIHFHLTPSVIEAADNWRRGRTASIVMTMHDYHSIVPCDGCMNNSTYEICDKCLDGHYVRCAAGSCTRGGRAKSVVAAMEAYHWAKKHVYERLDLSVCPSSCMQFKFESTRSFRGKTVHLPNFTGAKRIHVVPEKGGYVLYFGAYNRDKGVGTLLDVAERHPEIPFVFCGKGDQRFTTRMKAMSNVEDRGFLTGKALRDVVGRATLAAVPSECLENSPFAVLEALSAGTPVLGANAGGIPELIEDGITGELFRFRDPADLEEHLVSMWGDRVRLARYTKNCLSWSPMTPERYVKEIVKIYEDPRAALVRRG